ncbi:TonB-dependent receptor [Dysgonomonas sp. Marseille-P4677]|uniref:SusC/RagA family TonB-linked outer membrane protein n=1 Tax=Dysgonomonas sp. Marseille-P4677 TaxID=2364790 RepID=UPI00191186FA|nr:TonB-dependent receptor [Dysgonomonas sp. Marseille-P4677]MBK5720293.1 TonB-dependent receptor [Dysgonomonas sp. Marseille-P4677]
MKKRVMLILSCLFLSIGFIVAQTTKISGTVVDSNGEPVISASVVVKGTTVGTVTDLDGKFSINVPSGNNTLVFTLVGMKSVEARAISGMNVVMENDDNILGDVVVTGYGVTKKAAFAGAASTIGQANIEARNDANAIKSLDGVVPGLQMNIGSGQPGAPANVFIRGRNSINSGTQPLYVIDGIPVSSDIMGTRKDEGQELSPLSTLSSSDIESITVLKDATATSIYGARAANGVIVITTKKGKSGKPTVNFTAKLGFETRPAQNSRYKLVDATKTVELAREAAQNAYDLYGSDSSVDYYNQAVGLGLDYSNPNWTSDFYLAFLTHPYLVGADASYANNTNWYDEVTRTGMIQEYNIDLSGGAANATAPKYYLSFNYLNNESFIIGKDLERYSFRFNFDQAPTKFVKYGLNTNLSLTETNMGAGGGYYTDPITQAYMQSPLTNVKDENGEWNFATVNGYNPVAQRSSLGDISSQKQYRAILAPYLQLNFTDELTFTSRFGADIYYLDEFGYWSFLQPQGKGMRGMGENTNATRNLLTITNTLNYIKTFKEKHNLNVLLGQEGQRTSSKEAYLAGSNYPVDYLNSVDNAAVPGSASTIKNELVLNSYFTNVQYDYMSKYYLSGSFRYDGSSRFGADNRWAPFWSVGAKYRLTGEDFMASTADWLNNVNIRASYGTTGNQEVGRIGMDGWYAANNLFGFAYNYNGLPGSGHLQFGNSKLKWEQTNKFNVGIDLALFKFLNIELDYYNHKTTDMVFAIPTSFTTGLNSYYSNIGELSNKGVEVSVSANIINNADLKWNVVLTGSHNKNKIEKLSTDNPIETTTTIREVGRPYYTFKMKEWAGVDPETGDGLWYLNEEGDETTTNYNLAKKRYVGTGDPDFIGSFSSRLEWKGFDFAFQLNYSVGGKVYGNNLRYDEQVGGAYTQGYTQYVYDNRWQKPGDIAAVPRLTALDTGYENSASTRFLMDGDYLKIRSLTLGYTLPKSLLAKAFINNARVFVNAENLYTFSASNYRGFDPSGITADGVQWWNFPLPRSVVFGLTLGF